MTLAKPETSLQIDPSDGYAYYQVLDANSVLAEIVATNTADDVWGSGMTAGTEYWRITNNAGLKTSDYPVLFILKVRAGLWASTGAPPFRAQVANFSVPGAVLWLVDINRARFHKPEDNSDGGFALDIHVASDARWAGTMKFFRSSTRLLFSTIPVGTRRQFVLAEHDFTESVRVELASASAP